MISFESMTPVRSGDVEVEMGLHGHTDAFMPETSPDLCAVTT